MSKFIRIDDVQGTAMDINPDHIEMMKPSGDPASPGIVQIAGKGMKVKQTVDEIKELIRLSRQRGTL
jgi:uncharacterized protein YlzI (FlbEa/FlbD family)